jgi:hypothetical protein
MVASMICFLAGFLTLIGGVLAVLIALYAFSVEQMQLTQPRPVSDAVLAAVPGVIVALVGIALLICSRQLDEQGPVRRYGKRKRA